MFKVLTDGIERWKSSIITPDMQPEQVEVGLFGVKTLELVVEDAGDGITHDHALWLEPKLE